MHTGGQQTWREEKQGEQKWKKRKDLSTERDKNQKTAKEPTRSMKFWEPHLKRKLDLTIQCGARVLGGVTHNCQVDHTRPASEPP